DATLFVFNEETEETSNHRASSAIFVSHKTVWQTLPLHGAIFVSHKTIWQITAACAIIVSHKTVGKHCRCVVPFSCLTKRLGKHYRCIVPFSCLTKRFGKHYRCMVPFSCLTKRFGKHYRCIVPFSCLTKRQTLPLHWCHFRVFRLDISKMAAVVCTKSRNATYRG
ncbi:Hypothetical protein, putative, partial [Bodo saltans]